MEGLRQTQIQWARGHVRPSFERVAVFDFRDQNARQFATFLPLRANDTVEMHIISWGGEGIRKEERIAHLNRKICVFGTFDKTAHCHYDILFSRAMKSCFMQLRHPVRVSVFFWWFRSEDHVPAGIILQSFDVSFSYFWLAKSNIVPLIGPDWEWQLSPSNKYGTL